MNQLNKFTFCLKNSVDSTLKVIFYFFFAQVMINESVRRKKMPKKCKCLLLKHEPLRRLIGLDLKAGEERPKAMNCWLIKPGKNSSSRM